MSWQLRLHELALNRTLGAAELVVGALDRLADAFSHPESFEPDVVRKALIDLRFGQPSMAPILNLTSEIGHWLDVPDSNLDRTGWINRMRRDLQEQQTQAAAAAERIVARFRTIEIPGERFGFYSWSSTVANGLRALTKAPTGKRAFVAKSHPGGEGEKTADFLAKIGWQVWLVSDAQLADMARLGKLDTLVLGCDAFTDTLFVNKVGSGALAALMQTAGKTVEIWTIEDKHVNPEDIHQLDIGEHEPSPPISTGIATPSPLFGKGLMQDVNVIRTPDVDIEIAQLVQHPFRRNIPIPEYLKLENRPG
jgi:translation initiation factor 2B subunit (eIF-2B alpha/beta/delta family)